MSITGLDAATLARSLRRMAGDGSVEWVMEPIQSSVLRDIADMLDENKKLRELTRDYLIFYSQPGCTYCFCHDECRESEEPCMAFERLVDRTNELGIEVPQ